MSIYDSFRRKRGILIVFSGPSGVGKDTVLEEFLRICPGVKRCVTATTRDPREGEVPGVDYHFLTREEFQELIDSGGFLEYAEVHGSFYGTPRKWVEETLATSTDVILKIDVQGGVAVKKLAPGARMIFLAPPSIEELGKRLRGRKTESNIEVAKRLHDAKGELEQIPEYNYLIENGDVAEAVDKLRCIITSERSRIER